MFRRHKKRTAALVSLLALIVAGGAVAYFTASGSGSGSATVGTSTPVTLTGATSGTLYPGTSETVTLSATNPSSGHEEVGTVHLSGIKACTGGTGNDSVWNGSSCSDSTNGGHEVTACEDFNNGSSANADTADFYMADVAENQDLASGSSSLTNNGTLTMNDLNSSQNACENVNLYLTFTS